MLYHLGRGWEECPERDVISARFPCFHRQVPAVVACNTDLRLRPKQAARFFRISVSLSQMNAIGMQAFGERYVVIHDKGRFMCRADRLQRLCQPRRLMLRHIFDAKLKGRDRAAG